MPDRDEGGGPIGIGEVYRRLVAMEQRLDARLDKLVTNDRYTAEQKAQDDRMAIGFADSAKDIGELQEGRKWNLRFAVSALVVGFLMPALVLVLALFVTGGAKP
jgi:hypothetical protein